MSPLQEALERFNSQEEERELARDLRRQTALGTLRAGQFEQMRAVIPQWWEWVGTGMAYFDGEIDEWIDRCLARTTGLAAAVAEEWVGFAAPLVDGHISSSCSYSYSAVRKRRVGAGDLVADQSPPPTAASSPPGCGD